MFKTGGPLQKDGLVLSKDLISTFEVGKVFPESSTNYSLDFDHTGGFCLTSSSDETLRLFDVKSGKIKGTANSKKYGCSLARFSHKPTNIIFASTKGDDAIRYLSFHDNKFIRYFKGHTKKVVSMDVSPQDDTFLSAALDDTVRLWDIRSPNCQALMNTLSRGGRPCVAFDQGGLIFAVGLQSQTVRLYDLKNFENGAFSSFPIFDPITKKPTAEWSSIKISNDGNNILIVTKADVHYIVDAFEGHVKHILRGHLNDSGLEIDANFTPDGMFVYSGSQDGNVYFWDVETGAEIASLQVNCVPCTAVAWNPKYMMFASADSNLAFWTPT